MPLTANGFERLTYNDIVSKKIKKAKELFGEDIDTSELTPLGKFIRINAFDLSEAEEEAEYIYYSIFPNTASGVSLDRLCTFVGISRNAATAARYKVTVYGTDGYTVPIGFTVGTVDGVNFYNITATEIMNGSCEVIVVCTETGVTGNIQPEKIKMVVNPVAEVTSVVGVSVEVTGEGEETDYALRKRFEQAREGAGSCTETSIRAALMRVPTVESVGIIANDTAETVDGRPPFSFECYIYGGENYETEIAETIYTKKPIGIKTYGKIQKTVTDEGGYEHVINFSHTEDINVYVSAKIKTDTTFEGDEGITEIQNNLINYINGLGVGEPVILSSLYGKIHSVQGVDEVMILTLSNDGSAYSTANIAIDSYQVAVCKKVSVEVIS